MIRCEMLTAGYGGKEVLHEISWEAEKGKFTAIIGPNGSGKSTLLKTILGQTKICAGDICLEGKPIKEFGSRELAKRIAYLPQHRDDTGISVGRLVLHGRFSYIAFPRHYTDADKEKVGQALKKMGIEALRDKPVSELSGGEKQKVYLAMALAQDSPLFFLDEPAASLDISCQLSLMAMLKELSGEGKTIVAVTHDLNYALQYADKLLIINKGRAEQYGSPEEVLETGVMEKVFGLHINRLKDKNGQPYYFFATI